MTTATEKETGWVTQVMGAVVDVEFGEDTLPEIYTALTVSNSSADEGDGKLTLEVAQHLGDNIARTIAMDTTDGLVRGMPVVDTAPR